MYIIHPGNNNDQQYMYLCEQKFHVNRWITVGGSESASVTDIYGTVIIDSKIEENIHNEDEDWKWFGDDSISISL